jgi:hypothetical protein
MTGATIVFAPQIADQILDRLPATEAGAMTCSDLQPFFPDKRGSELRRALARLYSARIVSRKYVVEHQARTWRYWRSGQ